MSPQDLIAHGYDHIAEKYRGWAAGVRVAEREKYTQRVLDKLPAGAALLELGCGCGLPTTQALAQKFRVTGVDISSAQIALAQANVPTATFLQADMTALDFPPASFEAVAAFYAFGHLPRTELPNLLQSIGRWLKPGGFLLASFGVGDDPGGVEADWLGVPMFFSSWDAATNTALVQAAGLTVLSATPETAAEDGAPVTFLWIVASKR